MKTNPSPRKRGPKKFYILEPGDEQPFAFVPHPEEAGRWLRVHPCVAVVECECGARAGEPCINKQTGKWTVDIHYKRSWGSKTKLQEIKRCQTTVVALMPRGTEQITS